MKVRFKWNDNSFYRIRSAPKVIDALENIGRHIVKNANDSLPERRGYRMSSRQGARRPYGRWQVHVYTSSDHAKRSEAVNHTLLQVLNSQ